MLLILAFVLASNCSPTIPVELIQYSRGEIAFKQIPDSVLMQYEKEECRELWGIGDGWIWDILAAYPPPSAGYSEPTTYEVINGDLSIWGISLKLGVSFGRFLDANSHLDNPNLIHVGDVLLLP